MTNIKSLKKQTYIPMMIDEVIEIKKHTNFNREDDWMTTCLGSHR